MVIYCPPPTHAHTQKKPRLKQYVNLTLLPPTYRGRAVRAFCYVLMSTHLQLVLTCLVLFLIQAILPFLGKLPASLPVSAVHCLLVGGKHTRKTSKTELSYQFSCFGTLSSVLYFRKVGLGFEQTFLSISSLKTFELPFERSACEPLLLNCNKLSLISNFKNKKPPNKTKKVTWSCWASSMFW